MLFKPVIAALSAILLSTTLAQAQSAGQLGGPRNLPPAGFAGQQFVDNAGCVFLKAGFGGQVNWVPRVKANRSQLCGQPPTFSNAAAAAVEANMAPEATVTVPVIAQPVPRAPVLAPIIAAPRPMAVAAPTYVAPVPAQPTYTAPRRSFFAMLFGRQSVGNPIPLVPMAQATAPVVPVLPQVATQSGYATVPASGQGQCGQPAPQLESVLLRNGGTALVCTRGDGTLTGWRPPYFAQGVVGQALTPQMMAGARLQPAGRYAVAQPTNAIPTPPRGYKLAWTDDRLNPRRGLGTANGQAQQDQVWTRDIPAQLATAAPQAAAVQATGHTRVTVSSMSAPASEPLPATRQASYVQVGTFGQPANADGVRARLASLGLPVSTAKITRKGKVLQIVFAGPFATTAEAQAALVAARGAGYGDAILK